jgi:hypothetical protein
MIIYYSDSYNGAGILCDIAGNIYDGDFIDMKFNGFGQLKLSNGTSYVGQFKDGVYHGKVRIVNYNLGTINFK